MCQAPFQPCMWIIPFNSHNYPTNSLWLLPLSPNILSNKRTKAMGGRTFRNHKVNQEGKQDPNLRIGIVKSIWHSKHSWQSWPVSTPVLFLNWVSTIWRIWKTLLLSNCSWLFNVTGKTFFFFLFSGSSTFSNTNNLASKVPAKGTEP